VQKSESMLEREPEFRSAAWAIKISTGYAGCRRGVYDGLRWRVKVPPNAVFFVYLVVCGRSCTSWFQEGFAAWHEAARAATHLPRGSTLRWCTLVSIFAAAA